MTLSQCSTKLECQKSIGISCDSSGGRTDTSKDPLEFRMAVHLFGTTLTPGCANYALKASANFIRRECYVDDGL